MFFYLSKIYWAMAQPASAAAILVGLALVAMALSWRKVGTGFAALAFIILGLGIWSNVGAVIMQPLEDRFTRPAQVPEKVDGIIVLGGAFEGRVSEVRGWPELSESGDRFTEAAALALRYPDARILVSGGSGTIMQETAGDADLAPAFLGALGIDPSRIIAERDSRNTEENIDFSKALVSPQPDQTWLLVTSAFHMPRSVGLFRKAGWEVVPWPADYRTPGNEIPGLCRDDSMRCMRQLTTGIREWIGLAAYRATGRIDEIFPAP
ncbi:MAG: YdcF family protein [Mesorhizobium sp.]